MGALLDEHEQQLWQAWKAAADRVRQNVADEIKAETGLSDPDFGILTRLVDLGDGQLRQNELGASMQWHRSRLSHQLTRMEQRGLLSRSDVGGGVLVRITPHGSELVRTARPVHAAAVRRHLVTPTRGIDQSVLLQTLARLASEVPPSDDR